MSSWFIDSRRDVKGGKGRKKGKGETKGGVRGHGGPEAKTMAKTVPTGELQDHDPIHGTEGRGTNETKGVARGAKG